MGKSLVCLGLTPVFFSLTAALVCFSAFLLAGGFFFAEGFFFLSAMAHLTQEIRSFEVID
jgi:hypothetical protein